MNILKPYSILTPLLIISLIITAPTSVKAEQTDEGHSKWADGSYAEYSLSMTNSGGTYPGSLSFNVINGTITIDLNIDPLGTPIHKSLQAIIEDDKTYIDGKEAVLPFFYTGGKVVSYSSYSEVVSAFTNYSGNIAGGITNGQPVISVTVDQPYERFNKTYETSIYYDFGTNSGLLFSADMPDYSILFDEILGIQGIDGSYSAFHISLIDTNIDLGPKNIVGMIVSYTISFAPIIIVIVLLALFVLLYNRSRRNQGRQGKKYKL